MKRKVLLVDDDVDILRGFARTLRNQPYDVLTARCANDALQILKLGRVDLVVTDEFMPGMSGTGLASWIVENIPDVVRIVLTGQPNIPTMMSAVNDGQVFRILTKPCNDLDLVVAIAEGLESISDSEPQEAVS